MKNSVRKRAYRPKSTKKEEIFLYNVSSMGIIIEVVVGAILGTALCFGFVLSFFILSGSLLFSMVLFFSILIVAAVIALLIKYVFVSVLVRMKEIEMLERFFGRR